jgi:SAM-dependent methyltransferase
LTLQAIRLSEFPVVSTHRFGGASDDSPVSPHDALIGRQFGLQAERFAQSPELHSDAQLGLLVEAAEPKPTDESLDVACGPGTVVVAFARHVHRAVGLDLTPEMLDQARALAAEHKLANVEWQLGDVYRLPFADGAFSIVTCRFAFHHLQNPSMAFAEMARVCRPGGRVVLCDAAAPPDPRKAQAFNAMERHRDPSTVEFRTLAYLHGLFAAAGFRPPRILRFLVTYERDQLVAKSFPVNDDRDALGRMIDDLIAIDAMDVGAAPGETRFIYPAVVLTATKA